ncbi:MAG: hemerythrin domain-containing protein [Burkholderiales bacterium]|nr:hemerythrin domain-containing protein [Burkholderiales bacterium]
MEWKTEYATGIRNIDAHHRKLMEFIALFENAVQHNAPGNEVRALFQRTKTFLQFHFDVEEALMRLVPYPGLDAHRTEHQQVLSQIEQLEQRAAGDIAPNDLAASMQACLADHIAAGDRLFAQYAHRLYGQASLP